jgi:hypothetical protein
MQPDHPAAALVVPESPQPLRGVTDSEIDRFEIDGVVLLRGVYPPEWVEYLRAAMTEVFDREPDAGKVGGTTTGKSETGDRTDMVDLVGRIRRADPDADVALSGDAEPRGRSIVETAACMWNDAVRRHHIQGPLPEIVAALTRSTEVALYSDQLFLKGPGSAIRTPWHQDKPYFLLQGTKVAVCWVPVDPVTIENGAMGYVIGSHRWGKTFVLSDFVSRTKAFPEVGGITMAGLDPLPPLESEPEQFDIRYFDAEPGDVIVHHWATLHGSTGNVSATSMRRAASVRYAGDDVTFLRRASSPEPFRNTIMLDDGDPLVKDHHFTRVWPRA